MNTAETTDPTERKRLTFGIDFDNTITADPPLFRWIIRMMRSREHEVVIVTGRSDEGEYGAEVRSVLASLFGEPGETVATWGGPRVPIWTPPIVFAGGAWKADAAKAAGYSVDIWIDDMPHYIAPQAADLLAFKVERSAVLTPAPAETGMAA